jgi:predicted kinase
VAKTLTDFLPAVRLRSDVERKRILGVDPRSDATGQGAYSSELTTRTYAGLEALAESVVKSGYVAVVDATFLKRAQRDRFRLLARRLDVPFMIIDCDAPVNELRDRILARRNRSDNVSDADLGVLDAQLESRESLSDVELAVSLAVRPGEPLNREQATEKYLRQLR